MLLKRLLTIPQRDFSCYERRLYEILRKEAKKRKTKLIVVDKDEVPESYLRKFPYLVFPDNVAIALGVAEAVGVDKETALRGMLNAPPDPGAVEIKYFNANRTRNVFVNAFAANEPQSTKAIFKQS